MRIHKRALILITFLVPIVLLAQTKTNGLISILKQTDALIVNSKYRNALEITKTALSKNISNRENAYLSAQLTRLYLNMDSLHAAQNSAEKSRVFAYKSKDEGAKAAAAFAYANLNSALGLPEQVIKEAQEGLKFLENNADQRLTSYFYYLLYGAYSHWNDTKKMTIYINQCIAAAKASKNLDMLANAYNGLATTYNLRSKKETDLSLSDSSMVFLRKAMTLYKENSHKVSLSTYSISSINIANQFLEGSQLDPNRRRDSILKYLNTAERIILKSGEKSIELAYIYGIEGSMKLESGDLSGAEKRFLQTLKVLDQTDYNANSVYYTVFQNLSKVEQGKGNYKKALEYERKAEESLLKDFDVEQRRNAEKLEIQYQTAKKDRALELLRNKEEAHRKRNLWASAIISTLILAMFFMFRSYHFKLRYSIERQKKLKQEKEEANLQARLKDEEARRLDQEKKESAKRAAIQLKLEKEEQARLKAEQELMQLHRQQLEKEVMATALQVEHKNQVLYDLKTELENGGVSNLEQMIKEEIMMDKDFEKIKKQIDGLHPNFFPLLSEKSGNCLTDLDMKYCAYLHLKMPVKQIAQLMHVEPQSVRMTKYRIKQKLELTKDVNLDEFLQNVV